MRTLARFRALSPTVALVALVALAALAALLAGACTPPAEPAHTPPAASAPVVAAHVPAALPGVEPAPSVTAPEPTAAPGAEPAPSRPPPLVMQADLVDSPGDARLEPAAALLKANEALRARLALSKVVPTIDTSATIDVQMAAHALLGRACQSLEDAKCAAAHYQTVRELWKSPEAATKSMDAAGGDDSAKRLRTARALNAAGEALFYVGEEKRLAAHAKKFPVYTGKGDKDSVREHINTRVAPWVNTRRRLNEEADRAYLAVAGLQPMAPPRWVIAAASRVGEMWGRFIAEFRTAPIPNEWKKPGLIPGSSTMTWEEVRKDYYEALDEASEPQLASARAAFQKCQDLAQKYAQHDAYSKRCDEWLAKSPRAATTP